ncbi:hypothetical protein EHS25_002711 [Saitozyma podzolica]|jgi:hypothetical protein|uniref:Uncharacterized protein n=1 Tax=Saitozyma podzolica TaxID=1890683 RepID=A0A427YCZ7_9TREE|nr:hypothetical protein EHS25_002711 [Saitozyma podzolica]
MSLPVRPTAPVWDPVEKDIYERAHNQEDPTETTAELLWEGRGHGPPGTDFPIALAASSDEVEGSLDPIHQFHEAVLVETASPSVAVGGEAQPGTRSSAPGTSVIRAPASGLIPLDQVHTVAHPHGLTRGEGPGPHGSDDPHAAQYYLHHAHPDAAERAEMEQAGLTAPAAGLQRKM